MSEIVQHLGFDASAALATLDKLNGALGKLESQLSSVANATKAFNKTGDAAKKLGTSFKDGVGTAVDYSQKLHTSLLLLSRIVFTQAIIRGLSTLRNAFQDTAAEASEFQRQIALIQTLDNEGTNFDVLANRVRGISDQFNIPLLDAANAAYNALSNQVGDVGETLEFTTKAAKFAKATNSTLADSVDLLSAALKSYNLTVRDTDKVSAILFTAIDKGRLTADEMANALGRILPTAEATGASLSEVAAALAAISVRGSGTSETITQLRSILSAFQKPSVAMQEQLEKMGFTSGAAAIEALGLGKALEEVAASANGSQSVLARLFPNVRALGGATSLTSDGLKEFAKDLQAAEKAGTDFTQSKFLIATATDAERVSREINLLRNALTVDLGQAVLRNVADFATWTGGAQSLINAAQSVGFGVGALGGALLILGGRAKFVSAESTKLAKSLNLLSSAAAAVGVGSIIGAGIDTALTQAARAGRLDVERRNSFELKALEELNANKLRISEQLLDRELRLIKDRSRAFSKAYVDDLKLARLADAARLDSTKVTANRIVDAYQGMTDELAQIAAASRSIFASSQGRVASLTADADRQRFARVLEGADDASQAVAELGRAYKLAQDAAAALAKATDPAQVSAALAKFDESRALAQSAQQIGQRTNNRELESRAAATLLKLTNDQIGAEKKLQEEARKRAEAAEAQRKLRQKDTDELRQQVAILLDSTAQFRNGVRVDDAEQAQRRADALRAIASKALSSQDLDAAGALGVAGFIQENLAALTQTPIDLQFSVQGGVAELQSQLTRAFDKFRLEVNVAPLERILGRQFVDPEDFVRGLGEARGLATGKETQLAEIGEAEKRAQGLRNELAKIFEFVDRPAPIGRQIFGDAETANALIRLRAIVGEMKNLAASTNVPQERVRRLFLELDRLREGLGPIDAKLLDRDLSEAAIGLTKLRDLGQTLDQSKGGEKLRTEIRNINQAIDAAQFGAGGLGGQMGVVAGAMQVAANNSERFASALERAATASRNLSIPTVSVQAKQFGGLVQHFANGGFARGMDTIPVMARKGEAFINPKSTQRFFSQIQAINAGMNPVYRQNGGTTTIGDTSVTFNISGAESPAETASAVRRQMQRFDRERRRGTGR